MLNTIRHIVSKIQVILSTNPLFALMIMVLLPALAAFGAGFVPLLLTSLLALTLWKNPELKPEVTKSTSARTTNDILKEFLDLSERPTFFLNASGRIAYYNPAIKALFSNIGEGQPLAQVIRAPSVITAAEQALSEGKNLLTPFQSQRYEGRYFEAIFTFVEAPYSRLLGASLVVEIRDRTEERALDESRRDFIANASHELRTPLAAIKGGLETIENHPDDPSALLTFLPLMQKQTTRMERMIDDLLILSQIESQSKVSAKATLAVTALQDDLRDHYFAIDKKLAKSIKFDIDDASVRINADRDQMLQVFTNLIDNAHKYGKAPVEISLAKDDPRYPNLIGIQVKDHGEGIAPEHISRLTERFFRIQAKDKSGTGLGLAIVKHILRRHNGHLQVQSQLGKGSTFTIWLKKG